MVARVGATPPTVMGATWSRFSSRKEYPKTPNAPGVLVRVPMIALSFSPESTQAPSARRRLLRVLKAFSSLPFSALSTGSFAAPASMASSRKASRVPEVGGGP